MSKTEVCLHCGGRLLYDQEDKEHRCLNCGRPAPNSDNHNKEAEHIPPVTDEIAKVAKSECRELPHEIESPQGCQQCKNSGKTWLICKGKEFYDPRDIRFCPHQIIWTLRNAELLHEGVWPPEPITSGYSSVPVIKKGGGKDAKFTKPVEIIAEVERRLEHCRLDGLMILLYYAHDFDARELAKYFRCSEADILHRTDAVIWKVAGWNFRPEFPYRRWLAYRDYENWESQRKVEA